MDLECKLILWIRNGNVQSFHNYHVKDVETLIKRNI